MLIKLTDSNGLTMNSVKWDVGKTNSINIELRKPELCSNGVFHAYESLNLALLMNPAHANIKNPSIFEISANIEVRKADKCGTYEATTIRELEMPEWYKNIKTRLAVCVKFAISVAANAESSVAANAASYAAAYAASYADADDAYYAAAAAARSAIHYYSSIPCDKEINLVLLADEAVANVMSKGG